MSDAEYSNVPSNTHNVEPHDSGTAAEVAVPELDARKKAKPTIRRLDTLSALDNFQSDGSSILKVTRKGQVELIELPIRSQGIGELIERFQKSQPVPPSTKEFIKQDSEVGRSMGLNRDKWVLMPNSSDPGYQQAMVQWQLDMTYAIVMQALNVTITDEDGSVVYNPDDPSKQNSERAVQLMKKMGFTQAHFSTIATDAQELTVLSDEEKESFFSAS